MDESWHYKPEDWVHNYYKNRQITSKIETTSESEDEENDYDGESELERNKDESEVDDYDGESQFDSSQNYKIYIFWMLLIYFKNIFGTKQYYCADNTRII